MLNRHELIKLKAAALLHDPPHKAWIVLGRYSVVGEGGRAHEREARRLANTITKETVLEAVSDALSSELVRKADVLASSIDRLLHASEEEGRPWGALHIANIFDPSKKYPGENPQKLIPDKSKINEYVNELHEIIKEISQRSDLETAYHALYALLEPVWFRKVGLVGPADTRLPNHTIFDHLYATASAINIVSNKSIGGFAVLLDIAGIQSFVSKARKTSDYWAGSWLVSAMAWYLVREVVEKLGPDCLIMPTARLNPFYITWLLGRAKVRKYKRLKEALREYLRNIVGLGWPRNPVMPGTIVLILPENALELLGKETELSKDSGEGIREYFMKRFAEGWRKVIDAITNAARSDLSKSKLPLEAVEHLEKVLGTIKNVPPLLLRIKVLSFSDILRELREVFEEDAARSLLYHHAISRLFRKNISESIAAEVGALNEWSGLERGGKYTLCSMCDKLPSAVSHREHKRLSEWLLMKEGESLCPYCLVKRAIRQENVLENVVRGLVGDGVCVSEKVVFPSTADISATGAKLGLLRNIRCTRNDEVIRNAYAVLQETLDSVKSGTFLEGIPKILYDELKKIMEEYGEEDLRVLIGLMVLATDAENSILPKENIIKKLTDVGLSELVRGLSVNRYYAILVADGDDIGDVLSGKKWYAGDGEGGRVDALRRYYEEVLGKDLAAREDIKSVVGKCADRLDSILQTYESRFGTSGKGNKSIFMPLALSYHSCISRALMATAIMDSKEIERYGTVVYAGGDDLMALIPVVIEVNYMGGKDLELPFLTVVERTRQTFWGCFSGFITVGGISPALRAAGRTYSVKISHYKDPLCTNIDVARRCLSTGKHSCLLKITSGSNRNNRLCASKDSIVIGYGRGALEYVILPNRGCGKEELCKSIDFLAYLYKLVKGRKLSENVPRDVEEVADLINESLKDDLIDYACRFLKHSVARNARNESVLNEIFRRLSDLGFVELALEVEDYAAKSNSRKVWVPHALFRALNIVLRGER